MSDYEQQCSDLQESPRTWLVTGVAGFIGSNLLESLLRLGQTVVGLDNFSTGHRHNLEDVRSLVGDKAWSRFNFIEGDIRDLSTCRKASHRVDYILHQAALGSVPRSIEDPISSFSSNVMGTLNVFHAAKLEMVRRVVYASSSSVYGDSPNLPKVEGETGRLLSPYAVTKWVDELIADNFGCCYALESLGLRYFNVFGPRQDPNGPYAAVIPRWIQNLMQGAAVEINGDGLTSRDFCFVANVVQANILGATVKLPAKPNRAYNVAAGECTSLNQLFDMMREALLPHMPGLESARPVYRPFREGDIRHSLAELSAVQSHLGYRAEFTVSRGMKKTIDWYIHSKRRTEVR